MPRVGATTYINELLTIKPAAVDVMSEETDGVMRVDGQLQVFKMNSSLFNDEKRSSSNLVIPPGAADLWEAVCAKSLDDDDQIASRVAVVGSPGMGKSRSSVFLIRRFIDKRRERGMSPIVVYEHRKEFTVWIFVPKDPDSTASPYEAFSVDLSKFSADEVAALKNRSNLYIVDGDQVGARPMPALLDVYTVFVVSPDPEQISEFVKHSDRTLYFPAWRVADVVAARNYMTMKPFSPETYLTLMRAIGPNPRALFVTAGAALGNANAVFSAMKTASDGRDVINRILAGTTRFDDMALKQVKPFSKVMMITSSKVQGGFTQYQVEFRSEVVRLMVHISHVKTVVSTVLGNTSAVARAELGLTFELLVFGLAHAGWEVKLNVLKEEKPGCMKSIQFQFDEKKLGPMHIERNTPVSGADEKNFRDRVYEKAKGFPLCKQDKLVDARPLCIGRNHPLFDLAAAKNVVLDATVGAKKNLDLKKVEDTLESLDLQGDTDTLLHLVYVLPPGWTDRFKWSKGGWPKVAEAASEEDKMRSKEAKEALLSRLRVYTAEVPLLDDPIWAKVTSVMTGSATALVEDVRFSLENEVSNLTAK